MITSPNLYDRPLIKFSTQPMTPTTFTGIFKAAIVCIDPITVALPGHVHLHIHHRVGRFERKASGVKRHAFADESQRRLARGATAIPQNDQSRWPFRTRGHGQQRVATLRLQTLFIPDLYLDRVPFAKFLTAGRDRLGINEVGWAVH